MQSLLDSMQSLLDSRSCSGLCSSKNSKLAKLRDPPTAFPKLRARGHRMQMEVR